MDRHSLFIAIILLCALNAFAGEGLPLIEEEVDEILVISVYKEKENGDTEHCHDRIIFFRHGSVLATRQLVDDMIWTVNGSGEFILQWQDYWTAERRVTTKNFSASYEPYVDTGDGGPWWDMRRNMRDLKQP